MLDNALSQSGKENAPVKVAAEDAELVKKIRRVLKTGNNVEIRQDKNGTTKVFKVSREIEK